MADSEVAEHRATSARLAALTHPSLTIEGLHHLANLAELGGLDWDAKVLRDEIKKRLA